MKFHFLKLIGPRPTFPGDATDAERAAMAAHVGYWNDWMAKGHVVVFGPVMAKPEVFGMAVLQLGDDVDPWTLANADPVITAKLGFTWEVWPMPRVNLPAR